MSKIKLTKGELKRQRDSLKQFQRYLPTLQLKKQQLQMKILEFRRVLAEKQAGLNRKESMKSGSGFWPTRSWAGGLKAMGGPRSG